MGNCTLWIAGEIAKDLGLSGQEFPSRILGVKQLLYEVLKDGQSRDIIMLPFFRNYGEVVGHIRDRGIVGPIIIYTQGETLFMNISDMASQGVLFMDASRFGKPMMVGFLTFLRLSQEAIGPEVAPEQVPQRVPSKATRDVDEIKDMMRDMLFMAGTPHRHSGYGAPVSQDQGRVDTEGRKALSEENLPAVAGRYAHDDGFVCRGDIA